MNTFRIAERKNSGENIIRFDLPEFTTAEEAHAFVQWELLDWDEVNLFVTPIEAKVGA